MASRANSIRQLDLFVPALSNIQLRDQREVMERPFFSLSKRKRLTPINYVSPDGSVTVVVEPHQKFGMPTIWDADLLIWAASTLLSIDPAYFAITGGRERWLYRVVRKHAGGAGPNGVTMKLQTLFEKSGAEGTYRRFKFELVKIIQKNNLPGFDLFLEIGTFPEPSMRMVPKNPRPAPEADDKLPMAVPSAFPKLSDTTLSLVRSKCPGLDVYAIKSDFDAYLASRAPPEDYQKAFYGFARQRYQRLAL